MIFFFLFFPFFYSTSLLLRPYLILIPFFQKIDLVPMMCHLGMINIIHYYETIKILDFAVFLFRYNLIRVY